MDSAPSETFDNKKKRSFLKNVLVVLISNLFSVVSGVLVGFLIPKALGVSEYGYYKTFTLYCSYLGILHFGFIDGIYLKFAGKKYEELDKRQFRTFTRFLFALESVVTLILVGVSFLFFNTEYFLVFLFVSLNVLATNFITYFEFISQITMRFKRMTLRNVIRCSLNIVSVSVLFALYTFRGVTIYNSVYVSIVLAVNYVLAIWYVVSYRQIVFGERTGFRAEKDTLFYFFKVGIPLLLSNLVAQLIFVVDQQFVNLAFDNETYSVYAFAYNMISLITIATGAISTVLYPTLKTIDEKSITKNYAKINSLLLSFVGFCLIAYYPLVLIVRRFLPSYGDSLPTFLIILPGVLISSSISVIKYNCYKTFGKINNYFIKSVVALALAVVADLVVYRVFGDTRSISIVSIFVLLFWYVLVELYFVRAYRVGWVGNLLYVLLILAAFYGISFLQNVYLGAGAYLLAYACITLCVFFPEVKDLFGRLKRKKQGADGARTGSNREGYAKGVCYEGFGDRRRRTTRLRRRKRTDPARDLCRRNGYPGRKRPDREGELVGVRRARYHRSGGGRKNGRKNRPRRNHPLRRVDQRRRRGGREEPGDGRADQRLRHRKSRARRQKDGVQVPLYLDRLRFRGNGRPPVGTRRSELLPAELVRGDQTAGRNRRLGAA